MTLSAGTRLGPYEIREPIGVGGMGEVFRAVDTRLHRSVAVKVLPATAVRGLKALTRFEREARAVAAITHPNILTIHDVGHDGDRAFLVTELLDGETLRERLRAGPLSPRKAAEIGVQVALGLAAAHERGIVHRDLKPENVFITREGHVKLLDFGLAHQKDTFPELAGAGDDPSPNSPLTNPDVAVGTPAYMSPEQVQGDVLDGRSDIFAFGAVLHEMLSGRPAFAGPTAEEVMTAVLQSEPELSTASRPIPPSLRRITARCLEKARDERFQSARDLAFALDTISSLSVDGSSTAANPARRPPRRPVWRIAVATGLLLAAALGLFLVQRARSAEHPVTVLRPLTYTGAESQAATAPDGQLLAFVSGRSGGSRIWLKRLPAGGETPLSGGPDDHDPAFSPNGDAILFVRGMGTHNVLHVMGVLGGDERRIVDDVTAGAFLPPDGSEIVFLRQLRDTPPVAYGVYVASRDGTGPREIARTTDNSILAGPRPSPDGQTIAIVALPSSANRGSAFLLVPRGGGETHRIEPPHSLGRLWAPAWSKGAHALLYTQVSSVRYGGSRLILQPLSGGKPRALISTPFEMRGVALVDGPRVVTENLALRSILREGPLSASAGQLTSGAGVDRQPVYSPDGRWLVFSSNRSADLEIWAVSLEDGRTRRLTDHPADDWDPGFLPDGRLIWSSGRSGNLEIWMAEPDGSGARQVTHDGVGAENPTATPDGWIVYHSGNPARPGIWKVRPDGSETRLLVPDPTLCPETSPDGRHVAYVIPALPGPEAILKVVRTEDGSPTSFEVRLPVPFATDLVVGRPRWKPDGSGLAFVTMDGRGRLGISVQDFDPLPGAPDTATTRRPLAGFLDEGRLETFALSPDGRRVAYSILEQRSELYLLEGLPGLPDAPVARSR